MCEHGLGSYAHKVTCWIPGIGVHWKNTRRSKMLRTCVLRVYHPNHAIFHTLTTDFSLRSSEPSQPRGRRHKGAAVEMCVSPLGSRRRPVANAAVPGGDENCTVAGYADHRKRSFSTGFIRVLMLQPAASESLFCQWFCMV